MAHHKPSPRTVDPTGNETRFLFIDGLRGIAATMVMLFHFHLNLKDFAVGSLPNALNAILEWCVLGVDVFFVLSGFVIAHSVRNAHLSSRYVWRFALRRSIRLDPPLWATVALEAGLIYVSLLVVPTLTARIPDMTVVLTNLTYTQHFFGEPDIVPVFWSLTYEVQFYLVLVISLAVLATRGSIAAERLRLLRWAALISVGYSVAVYCEIIESPLRGLFVDRWFQFALGVCAWAAFRSQANLRLFAIVAIGTFAFSLIFGPTDYRKFSSLAAVGTAVLVLGVARSGRMDRFLAGLIPQFLGRISYSLYLLHLCVGWRFISLCKLHFGPSLSASEAAIAFAGGVISSLVAAVALHALVEAPSMSLARRIRLPRRTV